MSNYPYPDYVPGETATPPSGCCRSCGRKKELTNGLCLKCAEVEKLMGECFDKTSKVDLSGHVGQRDELKTHFYFQFDPPWPSHTAADEYGRYLVVPSCFPLEDYIFPFRILHDAHILDRALQCGTFSFEETSYTVKDIDFDEQILTATRNS